MKSPNGDSHSPDMIDNAPFDKESWVVRGLTMLAHHILSRFLICGFYSSSSRCRRDICDERAPGIRGSLWREIDYVLLRGLKDPVSNGSTWIVSLHLYVDRCERIRAASAYDFWT